MRKSLLALVLLAGCASDTKYGECVGLGDWQNPKFSYDVSTRNIILGIIFIETIVVPVVVVTGKLFCPVGPARI